MAGVEQVSTQIANLAISHCGVSKPISSLETTKSLEAQMCRTYFDLARQATLRDSRWLFAVRQVAPALVANQPTPEWLYAYQYPSDAIRLLRFVSWRLSNDTRQSRVPYTIAQPVSILLSTLSPAPTTPYSQTTGQWIYTNWPGVNGQLLPTIIEYVFDNQDISQWTPDFIIAFSYKLAELIVTTITSGDPYSKKKSIQADYITAKNAAQDDNFNEEQRPEEPQSEFIRARDGEYGGIPGMYWVAEPAGYVVM